MPNDEAANAPGGAENTGRETTGEQTDGTTEASTDSEAGGRSYSQADLDRITARIRREEKTKFEKQATQAQLSEAEKLRAENESLRLSIRTRDAERLILEAVKAAGADDAEVVSAWIQAKVAVEYDEDGTIANLRDVITEAKARIPARFPKRPGTGNGADGQNSHAGQSMNDLIRHAAKRM